MKTVYGYTRVSTAKQGEGVSLSEQKSSIESYALKHNLQIKKWFEEKETAAKRGRPVFNKMLNLLKKKKADGLIIHKIDRSARNLRDWSDLGDLIDMGSDVHFSFEAIDFNTRGGRLSADIQAVIAADYIRNLREETKKGLYGRLKQGLYPYAAPIGYLNMGGGKRKEIDPVKGPLIKDLYRLYSSGLYGISEMAEIMYEKGLRTSRGGKVSRQRIAEILNNPFYFGIIKIFRTGETYQGVHQTLISRELFGRVQNVLNGKRHHSKVKRDFLYRRCIQCGECKKSLVAEKQKGHIYYRCKTTDCSTKTVREEFINQSIARFLSDLILSDADAEELQTLFVAEIKVLSTKRQGDKRDWQLELAQVEKRVERLTDKFVDDLIDESLYTKTRTKWLLKQSELREKLTNLESEKELTKAMFLDFLNWTGSLNEYYSRASTTQKRELLKTLSPNLSYLPGKLSIQPYSPFLELANTNSVYKCCLYRTSSTKRYKNVSSDEQNNAVEYKLTKAESGEFIVTRIQGSKPTQTKSDNLELLVGVIKSNLRQCHNVLTTLDQHEPTR